MPSRQPLSPQQRQNARVLAFLGSILIGAALVFRFIGFYRTFKAIAAMNFSEMSHKQEVQKTLSEVTQGLAQAGDTLGLGTWVLLVGGALLTYAWTAGRFRERWFFWVTLVFSLLLCWQPYVGTCFGLLWIWLLSCDRKQFSVQQAILLAE